MTMILPPLSMWLRVERPDRPRPVRIWLPLFLVWLLLLPLIVLVLLMTLIVDLVLFIAGERYHHYSLLLLNCFQVLAETRGTVVRIRGEQTIVDLAIS